ncbi:MAG: allophanate hydrolase [Opitutales bacterium]|nr:allophanate hydrolase [Opitutales bacterium]MCH8539451.1 allophanate hydrolase [Opitutales bacterium]
MTLPETLTLETFRQIYAGGTSPRDVLALLEERWEECEKTGNPVWINRRSLAELQEEAESLGQRKAECEALPLYGIPFAVKDNIDVRGLPTTAGCPEFAYRPEEEAMAVVLLRQAGAIVVGKTNLDQFATGLVGTRSPYGACGHARAPEWISGGSSSGSAVAVAAGLVPFSLGTDTAGSGRVPAAFHGLVGVKGTRGLVSTRGVVPACRSLDCVTLFAHSLAEAAEILGLLAKFDPRDPYSRRAKAFLRPAELGESEVFTFGVPRESEWCFFGDKEAERLYRAKIDALVKLGGVRRDIDDRPLREAAQLLYQGPWVAERTAAVEAFLQSNPDKIHPVVRKILESGKEKSAVEAYRGAYALEEYKRQTEDLWSTVDFLLLPTAPTMYRIAEVEKDPIRLNSRLGTYTNFVNLLDLAALAVPAGEREDNGLGFGVSLIAPAWSENHLFRWAALVQAEESVPSPLPGGGILFAVCGAHLRGQPLHGQLLALGATFVEETRTAPAYRLYALPTEPPKPALVQVEEGSGGSIQVELYRISEEGLGRLLTKVPAPLALGALRLQGDREVCGFLGAEGSCRKAVDITAYGSWRNWQKK